MQVTREELLLQVDQARWEWLKPHYQRGALIVVDGMLELAEVGERIAMDDTATVQSWLASRMLIKPTAEQFAEWEQQPDRLFAMLVVSPFVLVQETDLENKTKFA